MSSPAMLTPCKRKTETADANPPLTSPNDDKRKGRSSIAVASMEKSPKKARLQDERIDQTEAKQKSPTPLFKTVTPTLACTSSQRTSSSSAHQQQERKQEPNTLPSPPASVPSTSRGLDSDTSRLDQKMPAIERPAASSAITANTPKSRENPLFATEKPSPSKPSKQTLFSAKDTFPESQQQQQQSESRPPIEPLGDIDTVDGVFKKAALITTVSYVLLVTAVYAVYDLYDHNHVPQDANSQQEEAMERAVAQTAFFILLVSTIVQSIPLVMGTLNRMQNKNKNKTHAAPNDPTSGIMISAMVILSISLSSNALLAWGPRIVVVDPWVGSKVFLIRWCEWVPLSGLLTLLAETVDISTKEDAWRKPIIFAFCQVASTFCGLVFPYCQSATQWVVVMIFSFVLFVQIFPRVTSRRTLFYNTPKGRNVLEREYYDRRMFAYYLMLLCGLVWNALVVMYFMNIVNHIAFPADHPWRFNGLEITFDALFDVAAKVVYNRIIFVAHQAVFNSELRTTRQLNELKQLMSMLWVSSSDAIVISSMQTKHRKVSILSPSFLQLVGANLPLKNSSNPQEDSESMDADGDESTEAAKQQAALVLVTDHGKIATAYYVDTSCISDDPQPILAKEDLQHNVSLQALRITNAAWNTHKSHSEPLRALSIVHCDPNRSGKVMCEMKVSRHAERTVVAVVRDVTERYRRFEAESRVHAETIARQRDMHTANRFTRHEVKNGLLAGIELCRGLGQSLNEFKAMLGKSESFSPQTAVAMNDTSMKSIVDLDGTLRGVLDTVLAEVMAREVVHEVYQPRLEELDVPSMLVANLGMSKDKIPVTIRGGSMPKLLLDAQLIGHIHRNAVSNACKYGKQGGKVQTFVEFDAAKKEFRMEVINEPGTGHDTLLAMGESASEFVFAQGVRLQPHMKGKTEKKLDSSGDGAWIMQKCAKTMNGVCNIYFRKDITRFTLHCPATPVAQNNQPNYRDFVVPQNVWGIGVDDSKIQRKLLSRILTHVGIPSARQVLLGETHEDVTEFESTLMNLMEEHPTKKFLVIVDEHLDYDNLAKEQQDGVHSGSFMMKQILEHIPREYLARLLVLMRSANDSAVDIALYTQRTHGYFPKAIMQRDRTREILAPLWLSRFPEDSQFAKVVG